MTYTIQFDRAATRAQRGVDGRALRQILAAIEALADEPRPHGTKALTGPYKGYFRIQVGAHYRVLYSIDDEAQTVTVINLGSREGIY